MSDTSILVIGNCQADMLADCLRAMLPTARVELANLRRVGRKEVDVSALAQTTEHIFVQSNGKARAIDPSDAQVTEFPAISFTGFHPDLIYASHGADGVESPLSRNNSAIALFGWMNGLSLDATLALFRDDVFRAIGYYDHWQASLDSFIAGGDRVGLNLRPALERLVRSGCFMHATIHPRLPVMAEVARLLLAKIGIEPTLRHPENYLSDEMFKNVVWPVYPDIAKRLGIAGEYIFKSPKLVHRKGGGIGILTLEDFVALSFEKYASLTPDLIRCDRFQSEQFLKLRTLFGADRPKEVVTNPYRNLPNESFWRRAVARVAPSDIDPVVKARFQLRQTDKIATAGSCFAQHISRRLSASGHRYFVTEEGEDLSSDQRITGNYGVYSARFGNIYTVRQLVQLFDRAHGDFNPVEDVWQKAGTYIDPFRPEIELDGFPSKAALHADRRKHLQAVRRMFAELDIFVFTLGLTEGWRSKDDGAMFPVAPGVICDDVDPDRYEFVNFSAAEVVADTEAFINRLQRVNPRARIILTVSPVPLIATYEPRHVLVSTVASKAALRTAADQIQRRNSHVDYFPSFEIITGVNNGAYFESDLRTVATSGVDHVMKVFARHYMLGPVTPLTGIAQELANAQQIVCEEELLDA